MRSPPSSKLESGTVKVRVYRALRELGDRFSRSAENEHLMNCERIREQIPECLAGQLDAAARERLIEHLETCAACRARFGRAERRVERTGNHAATRALAAECGPTSWKLWRPTRRAYPEAQRRRVLLQLGPRLVAKLVARPPGLSSRVRRVVVDRRDYRRPLPGRAPLEARSSRNRLAQGPGGKSPPACGAVAVAGAIAQLTPAWRSPIAIQMSQPDQQVEQALLLRRESRFQR